VSERLIDSKDFGVLAEELIKNGGSFRFQARGSSMHPFIRDGETVEITAVDPDRIRLGDIVFCRLAENRLVLHRVVAIQRTAGMRVFLLQGDAHFWNDGFVDASQVIGRAAALLRQGKWVSLDAFPLSFYARLWRFIIPFRRFIVQMVRRIRP